MFVDGRDVVLICLDDGLFTLNKFYGVGNALGEAISRLVKGFVRQIDVAAGHVHLICRRIQVNKSLPHILVHLPSCVLVLRFALLQSGGRLQYVTVDAAAFEERNGECA